MDVGGVDLSKKIGPVPIWLIVAGGGLGIAYFVNKRMTPASDLSTPLVEPGVGGTPGGFIPAPDPADPVVPAMPLDNEEWAFKAVTWLVGQGYNPVTAGLAIRKYLDGQILSSSDAVLVQKAVAAIGVPPNVPVGGGIEIPPPPPGNPTPVTPPPAIPTTLGVWAKVPRGALPQSANNTSQILDYIMKHNGYPGGVADVTNRTRIWYHAYNTFRRVPLNNDWTRLTAEQHIFVPSP